MYLGSYGVASTYCLADSIDKGRQCYQESSHLSSYLQKRKAVETMVEAAIWQGLASVIIPGFTINRICAASRFTLSRYARGVPPNAQMWMTTIVGLSAIPFIIKPIDRWVKSVDNLLSLLKSEVTILWFLLEKLSPVCQNQSVLIFHNSLTPKI